MPRNGAPERDHRGHEVGTPGGRRPRQHAAEAVADQVHAAARLDVRAFERANQLGLEEVGAVGVEADIRRVGQVADAAQPAVEVRVIGVDPEEPGDRDHRRPIAIGDASAEPHRGRVQQTPVVGREQLTPQRQAMASRDLQRGLHGARRRRVSHRCLRRERGRRGSAVFGFPRFLDGRGAAAPGGVVRRDEAGGRGGPAWDAAAPLLWRNSPRTTSTGARSSTPAARRRSTKARSSCRTSGSRSSTAAASAMAPTNIRWL